MKNQIQAGGKNSRPAANKQPATSPVRGAASPHSTSVPNGMLPPGTPHHPSAAGGQGFLHHKRTQADLGGVATYQDFGHDEATAIFCLALTSVPALIFDRLLPELDEKDARMPAHQRRHVDWHEAVCIARLVLRRRALGALAGDDPERPFNLPLPGVAGFMAFTYEFLATEFSALFYYSRHELAEKVIPMVQDDDASTLIAEAIVLAENIEARMGNKTDLAEGEEFFAGLGTATEAMQDAWARKTEANYSRVMQSHRVTGGAR